MWVFFCGPKIDQEFVRLYLRESVRDSVCVSAWDDLSIGGLLSPFDCEILLKFVLATKRE